MCAGYCRTEVEISEQATTTLRAATRTQSQHPDKTFTSPTNSAEWQALEQVSDREALCGLPETIGCPDCADAPMLGLKWKRAARNTGSPSVTKLTYRPSSPCSTGYGKCGTGTPCSANRGTTPQKSRSRLGATFLGKCKRLPFGHAPGTA